MCGECNKPCKDNCVPDCSCPIKLDSLCVYYNDEKLDNIGVVKGESITSALKKINDAIPSTTAEQSLINIGAGANIYRQVDLDGYSELRRLTSSDNSVQVEETLDSIDFKVV